MNKDDILDDVEQYLDKLDKESADASAFCLEIQRLIAKYRKWQKKRSVPHSEACVVYNIGTWKRLGYIQQHKLKKLVETLPKRDKKLFDI